MSRKIKCINPETNEVKYFVPESANDPSFMKATGFVKAPEVPEEDSSENEGEQGRDVIQLVPVGEELPSGNPSTDIPPAGNQEIVSDKKEAIDHVDNDSDDDGTRDENNHGASGLPDDIEINDQDATNEIEPDEERVDLSKPAVHSKNPGKPLKSKSK